MGDLVKDDFSEDDEPISEMSSEKRHRVLAAAAAAGIDFIWDSTRKVYIDTATERLVAEATLKLYVRVIGEASRERLRSITEKEVAGEISRATWELAMRSEVKQLHTTMAVLARGGKDQMRQSDWGRLGNVIAKQNAYLNKFGSEVAHGMVSEEQQLARSEMYASSAYSTFENSRAAAQQESGIERARRVLEDGAQHCEDCEDFATDDFIPIDEVVPIGESECQANCRCVIEYEDTPRDAGAEAADEAA